MSDPFLTEFWRTAKLPQWRTLGPEIAKGIRRAIRRNFPVNQTHCNQWACSLRRERERRGMTQTEVGAAMGCSTTPIASAELNKASPDAEIWAKLAAFYGITLE